MNAPAAEILQRWRNRLEECRQLRASVDGAAICEQAIADLELVAATSDESLLTLTDAAELTGYSADHLSRLIRAGALPNHGRPRSPRVRLCECPRKAPSRIQAVAENSRLTYAPDADARALRSRR